MVSPSHNPVSSTQSLQEIAAVFIEVDHSEKTGQSEGRLYLIIDPKSQQVGTTTDQKLASSTETIALFVHQININFLKNPAHSMFYKTGHIRNQEGKKISLPRLLKNDLKEINNISAKLEAEFIEERTQGKRNRIRNVASHIFGREFNRVQQNRIDFARDYRFVLEKMEGIEEERKALLKGLKQKPVSLEEGKERENLDYGKSKVYVGVEDPIAVEKSNTYEKHAATKNRSKKTQQVADKVNFFSELATKPADQLNRSNIEAAFKREFAKQTNNDPVIKFMNGSFASVLDQLASQVEKGELKPEDASQQFVKDLKNHISEHNTNVLELDRETFELLVKGRSDTPLPVQNPAFKSLLEDYKNEKWVDQKNEKGEVINPKTMIYETLSKTPYKSSPGSEFLDALRDLDLVVNQEDFKTLLNSFFQHSTPKSSTSQSKNVSSVMSRTLRFTPRSLPIGLDSKNRMS